MTYKHGQRMIDPIWISSEVPPLVTDFGYLPYDLSFDADHLRMFVDIQTKFNEISRLLGKRRRKLNSENPKLVKAYLKIVGEKKTRT